MEDETINDIFVIGSRDFCRRDPKGAVGNAATSPAGDMARVNVFHRAGGYRALNTPTTLVPVPPFTPETMAV